MRGSLSHEHLREVLPDLCGCKGPEQSGKEEQAGAVTREDFRGDGLLQTSTRGFVVIHITLSTEKQT